MTMQIHAHKDGKSCPAHHCNLIGKETHPLNRATSPQPHVISTDPLAPKNTHDPGRISKDHVISTEGVQLHRTPQRRDPCICP